MGTDEPSGPNPPPPRPVRLDYYPIPSQPRSPPPEPLPLTEEEIEQTRRYWALLVWTAAIAFVGLLAMSLLLWLGVFGG